MLYEIEVPRYGRNMQAWTLLKPTFKIRYWFNPDKNVSFAFRPPSHMLPLQPFPSRDHAVVGRSPATAHLRSTSALDAISEDEEAAAAIGINVMREKPRVTVISAALTAFGGGPGAPAASSAHPAKGGPGVAVRHFHDRVDTR